jgi:hypothetical protein
MRGYAHVAAGLPPGHDETLDCPCSPFVYPDGGDGGLVVHRIAPPVMEWHPKEASHDAPRYEICSRDGCSHQRGFHWGIANGSAAEIADGFCTYPGRGPDHCERFVEACANCPHGENRHIVRTTGGRPRHCTAKVGIWANSEGTAAFVECGCTGYARHPHAEVREASLPDPAP